MVIKLANKSIQLIVSNQRTNKNSSGLTVQLERNNEKEKLMINGQNFPKFYERHKLTHPSLANSKQENYMENHKKM